LNVWPTFDQERESWGECLVAFILSVLNTTPT